MYVCDQTTYTQPRSGGGGEGGAAGARPDCRRRGRGCCATTTRASGRAGGRLLARPPGRPLSGAAARSRRLTVSRPPPSHRLTARPSGLDPGPPVCRVVVATAQAQQPTVCKMPPAAERTDCRSLQRREKEKLTRIAGTCCVECGRAGLCTATRRYRMYGASTGNVETSVAGQSWSPGAFGLV